MTVRFEVESFIWSSGWNKVGGTGSDGRSELDGSREAVWTRGRSRLDDIYFIYVILLHKDWRTWDSVVGELQEEK